jgi:hypothetical protein
MQVDFFARIKRIQVPVPFTRTLTKRLCPVKLPLDCFTFFAFAALQNKGEGNIFVHIPAFEYPIGTNVFADDKTVCRKHLFILPEVVSVASPGI